MRFDDTNILPTTACAQTVDGQPRLALESAQERANRTLDIWALIVQFCDKSTLSALARVKHEWEDLALRALWRTTPSLVPLFMVLGEMVRADHDEPWVRSEYGYPFIQQILIYFFRDFTSVLAINIGPASPNWHPSSANQA